MGVKLTDLVKPVVKNITIRNLLNKKIAIDAFNSIFQFLATIRQKDGTPLKDYNGTVTSHLSGLFYRNLNLIEHDIKPIYVFDGPPLQLKIKEIKKRRERRENAKHKMEQAQDAEDDREAKKYSQATSKLTPDMIFESKQLLDYMGIPWIEAVHDGEGEAARLINDGVVWASSSQDYDSLLFGAKRLVRNLNINRKKKKGNTIIELQIEYYTLEKVLNHLDITQDQLIDIGILMGVDFFEGFKGVGEKTAYNLIKDYGSIERIMEKEIVIKKNPILIDQELLGHIRDIFLNVEAPAEKKKLKWCPPNEDSIRELLLEKHNFNPQRLDKAIKRLIRKKSQKTQTSLDSFI